MARLRRRFSHAPNRLIHRSSHWRRHSDRPYLCRVLWLAAGMALTSAHLPPANAGSCLLRSASTWQNPAVDSIVHTQTKKVLLATRNVGSEGTVSFDSVVHDFHDTQHRAIKLCVVATSRFSEYFSTSRLSASDSFVRESTTGTFSIPSSAAPPAPRFLYAVPTFLWSDAAIRPHGSVMRTRRGNGLRLFLERPWGGSGEGEQLAVIIRPEQLAPMPHSFACRLPRTSPHHSTAGVDAGVSQRLPR